MDLIYSIHLRWIGADNLCWRPAKRQGFTVKCYYCSLSISGNTTFPWKIWQSKVSPRVAFFSWTAALGKILTIENLRYQRLILLDWCRMCKCSGESADHLLIHCSLASELWSMVFGLFEVQWVILEMLWSF